jgi:hypothetical protein
MKDKITADEMQKQLEDLTQKIKEAQDKLKEKDEEIQKISSLFENDKAEMVRKRQEAKDAEAKSLEEQQKYAELYANTKKEFQDYKEKYSEEKYGNLQKSLDEIVASQKQKLLLQIPEEDRELFRDMDIPKLEKLAQKFGTTPIGVDTTMGKVTTTTSKKWNEMSEKEQLDISASDPKKAQELIRESMKS